MFRARAGLECQGLGALKAEELACTHGSSRVAMELLKVDAGLEESESLLLGQKCLGAYRRTVASASPKSHQQFLDVTSWG